MPFVSKVFGVRQGPATSKRTAAWLTTSAGIVALCAFVYAAMASFTHGRDVSAYQTLLAVSGLMLSLLSGAAIMWARDRRDHEARENRLGEALESAGLRAWWFDARTRSIGWSERSARLLGKEARRAELPLTRFYELVDPDDRALVAEALTRAVDTERTIDIAFRVVLPSGGSRIVRAIAGPVRDSAGRFVGLAGLLKDPRARARVERAMRRNARRMALAAAAGHLGLWGIDRRSGRRWISRQALRMLGFTRLSEVSEPAFLGSVHPEDRERIRAAREVTLATGAPFDDDFRIVRPDGSICWLHAMARVLGRRPGEADELVGAFVDITRSREVELEAREQQRSLAHLSRVAVVGELSAAVAHELNQPLTSILANAQTALRMVADAQTSIDFAEIRAILADIIDSDRRAALVIQRVRGLMRNDPLAIGPLHPADLIDEVLGIMRSELLAREVTLQVDVDRSLPRFSGDRVQLQQVLVNVIVNACDAMADLPRAERRVIITASLDEQGDGRFSISDNGPGIAVTPPDRIFDPFVTSKSGGLGLGLVISRKIVVAHGGKIWAVNHPGHGATIHIGLPTIVESENMKADGQVSLMGRSDPRRSQKHWAGHPFGK